MIIPTTNAIPTIPKAEYTVCTNEAKGKKEIKNAAMHNSSVYFPLFEGDIFSTTATPDDTAVVIMAK